MPQPWERYQQPQQAGPWQQYAANNSESQQPTSAAPKTTSALRRVLESAAFIPQSEFLLNMGTGMVASPINEAIASGAAAIPGGFDDRDVLSDPPVETYQPRTEGGRAMVDIAGALMSPVSAAIDYATGVNDPNPGTRAWGHGIKAALGVLPLVGGRLRGARSVPRTPTVPELRSQSQAAYRAAEQGTGIVEQRGLGNLATRLEAKLADEGFDADLHPATMAGYNRLLNEATRPNVVGHSLKGLEQTRRVLSNAENAAKTADDARIAGMMLDEFDDFVTNLKPSDLVGGKGDAHVAAQNYRTARDLWHRMSKAQDIEALFERAKNAAGGYTQSGFENTLRIQFRQLADNPRRMGRFSAEEQAAILKVVRGGPIQNLARWAGKLAPRGPVSAGVAYLLGESIAPGGGLVLSGLGEGARGAAGVARARAATEVGEMVRRGPLPKPSPQEFNALARAARGLLPAANALQVQTDERGRPIINELRR